MEFSFDNNIPIYIQLLEYLKIYLISGVFKSGEKLPSVRDFATTFKVNPNTMQKALAELESMKLIYTERTNGKYVTKDEKLIFPLLLHNREDVLYMGKITELLNLCDFFKGNFEISDWSVSEYKDMDGNDKKELVVNIVDYT